MFDVANSTVPAYNVEETRWHEQKVWSERPSIADAGVM